ncbi:MAG TPA: peptidylprolyl isomerase [Candidatus Limiplasma sp.]|nr:peptidylprolyl isomerase [Candidatus Limiplasma sp.]
MSQDQNNQNKMKKYQIIIIVIAALIILGVAAFFIIRGTQDDADTATLQTIGTVDTDEVTDAVSATTFQIGMDDVVATVNGENVTGSDVLVYYEQMLSYYGEPDTDYVELYYSIAMEQAITMKLISLTAAEMGLDQYTDEELAELYATSDSEWQYALDNYVSYNLEETDETTDADREAAYADAESYYALLGYTKETLRESYLENETYERVKAALCEDVTVTDDEVQAYYDDAVAADQEAYEFDIDAYESQMLMYQYGYADEEPWYRPEGYRYIKNILLAVDDDLMTNYTDLVARYEEQMDDEEAGDTTDEDAQDVVTAEDIDAAKAAIIASVQTEIDEINAKLAEGVSFDDLMTEYGIDTTMTDGTYPNGYEVSLASYGYVTEFISAAFSVDEIGDVSEPYVSEYGVHIIKYAGDVPAGPVELTDDLKSLIYDELYDEKCDDVLNAWHEASDIQYTGVIRSLEEIQADEETSAE